MKTLYNLILKFDYFASHVFLYRALRLMEINTVHLSTIRSRNSIFCILDKRIEKDDVIIN